MVQIVQSALYCKGYKGGQVDGVFDAETVDGASSMKRDMGVAGAYPGAGITPKVFKALLTMDAYVVVGSGTAHPCVRSIQQWMNARYLPRPPHDSMGTHVRFIDQPRVPEPPAPDRRETLTPDGSDCSGLVGSRRFLEVWGSGGGRGRVRRCRA